VPFPTKLVRVTGLRENIEHFLTVTATNAFGESAASDPKGITTENYATPPKAPTLAYD